MKTIDDLADELEEIESDLARERAKAAPRSQTIAGLEARAVEKRNEIRAVVPRNWKD